MMILKYLLLLVFITFNAANALQTTWQQGAKSNTRIILGNSSGNALQGGLQVNMPSDEYHTYWRTPGEAGYETELKLLPGSSNIKDLKILYPYPKTFIEYDIKTYGYSGDEVVFPLQITLEDATKPATLNAKYIGAVC